MPSASSAPVPDSITVPRGFIWGVSTSGDQIEGADGEGIALMRELGVSACRFSVAWPLVLPQGRGAVSEAGLAFYDRLIDTLKDAGTEPWLCLHHTDLPQALDDLGGWTHRDTAGWFADYAAMIARRFGDRVRHFATFNGAPALSLPGSCTGAEPPGMASRAMLLRTVHHVNLAHGGAIDVLRAHVPRASLGIIHDCQPCLPSSHTPENVAAAEKRGAYWNNAYPDPQLLGHYPAPIAGAIAPYEQAGDLARICRPIDWFGLNHCSRTANDGPMQLNAFRDTILAVHQRYRLPVYITEIGTAGADALDIDGEVVDQPRIDFLKACTAAMFEAIRKGADVRGYFVRSLLDNFDRDWGDSQRFGIVYVDRPTQRRIPKASFHWYAGLIRASRRPPARAELLVSQTSSR